MQRWLVLTLGLGIAALAGYSLLTAQQGGRRATVPPEPTSLDEIDAASRARLGEILREADGEPSAAGPDRGTP